MILINFIFYKSFVIKIFFLIEINKNYKINFFESYGHFNRVDTVRSSSIYLKIFAITPLNAYLKELFEV